MGKYEYKHNVDGIASREWHSSKRPYFVLDVMKILYTEPTFREEDYPILCTWYHLLVRYILTGNENDGYVARKIRNICYKLENRMRGYKILTYSQKTSRYKYNYPIMYNDFEIYKKVKNDNK